MERHTDDVALATYLRMEGFEPQRIALRRPQHGSRKVIGEFAFQGTARLDACWDRYDREQARVEPRAFALAFRATRDILFDALQNR